MDENNIVAIPARYIEQAGYKLGDNIRLDLDERYIHIITGCIDGELFILGEYDDENEIYLASRVLH